jgi:(p)ppGpp synthase/HD superfamily hydrolase
MRVKVAAADRIGLAFTIMKAFKDLQVNIDSISSVTSLEKKAFFDITADFSGKQQAERLKRKLSSTKGIFSVQFY